MTEDRSDGSSKQIFKITAMLKWVGGPIHLSVRVRLASASPFSLSLSLALSLSLSLVLSLSPLKHFPLSLSRSFSLSRHQPGHA